MREIHLSLLSMNNSEGRSLRAIGPFLLGVGVSLTLMALYHAAGLYDDEPAVNKLRFANGGYETTVNVSNQGRFNDLAPVLKRVAGDDKTIIMTSVNWAWAQQDSLLDLFLRSFKAGDKIDHFLRHLLIVAFDSQAFDRCKTVHPYCYLLKVDVDFTGQQSFMSKGYIELVWSKIQLQQYILEQGYNFLFTDVDILWLRNPFKHITVYADMTTSSDGFKGDPFNTDQNTPNTGFFYVKSSNRTIAMMKYWHDARSRFPPNHEQHVFNMIKQEIVNSSSLAVKLQFVDTVYFGGLCSFSTDLSKICTMHANCCVNGLEAKLADLRILVDNWKNYTALSIEEKNKFTWRKPGHCRI